MIIIGQQEFDKAYDCILEKVIEEICVGTHSSIKDLHTLWIQSETIWIMQFKALGFLYSIIFATGSDYYKL